MYGVTAEEINLIVAYVNGENPELPETDIPERLMRLCSDMQKRILADVRGCHKARVKVEAKLEIAERKAQDKERHDIAAGNFANAGLDSIDVAHALAYQMCKASPHLPLSKSKLVLLLYECYAAWLAGHKELLTIEAPVYTKYGPQFWRVWNGFDRNRATEDAFRMLAERNAGVAKLVENVAKKYSDYAEDSLRTYYVKSLPIVEIVENDGKWNTPLRSSTIYQWKVSQS